MRHTIAIMGFALIAVTLGFLLMRADTFEAQGQQPLLAGRIVPIVSDLNLAAGETFISPFVDTTDCAVLAIMVEGPFGSLRDSLHVSPDGIITTGKFSQTNSNFQSRFSGNVTNYYYLSGGTPLVAPHTAVQLEEISGSGPAGVIELSLYCSS